MISTIADDLQHWIKHRRANLLPDPTALAMSTETFRFIVWQFCEGGMYVTTTDNHANAENGRIWNIPIKIDESIAFGRYVFIHSAGYMGVA